MPQKVQLAIQGGGAKVVPLFAALGAVQELVGSGRLEVTRVAGTSAGALAGALFAAGINLNERRAELKKLASNVVSDFGAPGPFALLRLLMGGRPLWSTDRLEKEIDGLLSGKGIAKFSDIKRLTGIDLFVISTDLTESSTTIHSATKQDDRVSKAVAHSCGIPFVFRTWSGCDANRVDGGICENLPVDVLVKEIKNYGPVIAISFDRPLPKSPKNVAGFCMALFDVAINNSVERARQRVGGENIFSIKCPFDTFDFKEALNRGFDDLYELVQIKSRQFFETYLDPEEETVGDPWETGDVTNMFKIGEMFTKQHREVPRRYSQITLDVTANCLLNPKSPDIVTYSATFQALGDPVFCHAVSLSSATHRTLIEKTQISVFDMTLKKTIETIRLYMKNADEPERRYVMVCFVPVLLPGNSSYSLKITDFVHGGMGPLLSPNRRDDLSVTPALGAKGMIGRIEFIARVPERFSAAKLVNKPNENWAQPMSDFELMERLTPGFRTIGVFGINLDASRTWAVDLTLV